MLKVMASVNRMYVRHVFNFVKLVLPPIIYNWDQWLNHYCYVKQHKIICNVSFQLLLTLIEKAEVNTDVRTKCLEGFMVMEKVLSLS